MAFDCLFVRGRDLRSRPLSYRRKAVEDAIAGAEYVFALRRLDRDGFAAFEEVKRRSLEGLVAKDETSVYAGGRTRAWLRVKLRRDGVFPIVGIAPTAAGHDGLLLAMRAHGLLRYVGTACHRGRDREPGREADPCDTWVPGAPRRRDVLWLKPRLLAEVTTTRLYRTVWSAPFGSFRSTYFIVFS